MRLGECIWNRRGETHDLTERSYFTLVAFLTMGGLFLSTTTAIATMRWMLPVPWILVLWFLIPLLGITIAVRSHRWWLSLIGYCVVTIAIGLGTGPIVARSNNGTAIAVLGATLGVAKATSITGLLFPQLIGRWWLYGIGLVTAVVSTRTAYTSLPLLGMSPDTWDAPWMGMAFVMLFGCHIVHDWQRAQHLPRTLDNAVDCSLAIYMDSINMSLTAIRTIRLIGKRSQPTHNEIPVEKL